MSEDLMRLVIFQINTAPFVIDVDKGKMNEYGNWILTSMDSGKTCVFRVGEPGKEEIMGAVRGPAIVGFRFEPIFERAEGGHPLYDDPEFVELSKRRLRLEVNNLENMSSGDEWKNNGF
jgi:hypothetical protein